MNTNFKKEFIKIIGPILLALYLFWITSGIDIYFASKISPETLAALQAVFPLFFLLLSINQAFSVATNNLVSIALGKNDLKAQNGYIKASIVLAFMIGLFFVVGGNYVAGYILGLFHIKPEIFSYGLDYIKILFYFSVFYFLMGSFWSMLVIFKKSQDIIIFAILTLLINVSLNYIFVFLLNLKTLGIALGTSLMNMFLIIFFLFKFSGYQGNNKLIRWDVTKFRESITYYFKDYFRYFFVAWFSMVVFVVEFIVNNYFVSKFGTYALAGYGLASWLVNFVNYPVFAIGIGFSTIFGYWLGKKQTKVLKQIWRFFVQINWFYILIAIIIVNLLLRHLLHFFTDNTEIISYASLNLIIFSIFLVIFAFTFFYSNFFQIVGMHWQRMILNIILVLLIGINEYIFYSWGGGYVWIWIGWLIAYLMVLILEILFFRIFSLKIFHEHF